MPTLTEVKPPTNPDAENNLIGSVIIDPGLMDEYSLDHVPPEAFWDESNRVLWRHLTALYWNDHPIDVPSLMESLRNAGDLERAGGVSYVMGVMDITGTGAYAHHYADTIMESYRKRRLLDVCANARLHVATDDYEAVRDSLMHALHEIDDREEHRLDEAAELAESFIEGGAEARLKTGFGSLDDMLGGLPVGDLTVLAARTSMGKSALAHNIAFRVKNTHILSPDQPLPEILIAEACRRSRVTYDSIRRGRVTDEQKDRWREARAKVVEELRTLVTIDDRHLTYDRMVSEVRRAARRGKKLVIVDHVQHVRPTYHKDKRLLMVDITGTLKAIAREENISILALSQLSRDLDHRNEKRPTLVDLSESKTLEEDANAVLFLYRDGYYHPGGDGSNLAEVIVGKSKTGARLSMTQLAWDGPFMEFHDITTGGFGR